MRRRAWGFSGLYSRSFETQCTRKRYAKGVDCTVGRVPRKRYVFLLALSPQACCSRIIECAPFIDTLFTVLRTKSYLPYGVNATTSSYPPSSSPSLDTGIPIPLDALLSPSIPSSERPRKRSMDSDELNGGPSAKGPRLSAEGQFSRYSNGRNDSRSTGGWGGHRDRNERQGANGQGLSMGHQNGRQPQPYRPPEMRRGICRDYHSTWPCTNRC
jgi:RNA-binding protein 26